MGKTKSIVRSQKSVKRKSQEERSGGQHLLPAAKGLLGHEEGENTQTFCKGHGDNAKGEDVTKGTWVAAHGLNSLGADQAHADSGAGTCNGLGDVSGNASCGYFGGCGNGHGDDFGDHDVVSLMVVLRAHIHTLRMVLRANGPAVLVVVCTLLMAMVVMGGGELDIHGAKQGENDGLEQAHEQLHEVEGEGNEHGAYH